ncbi:MAG: DNA repair protein RecN [Anaerolineales bacterium]|nr:DNA repair protein RecN [Anaerolineales bacterium]
MLLELLITDFAIIDKLYIRFDTGFSVLTGETGAGKSIIIDGVNLLLGSRADSSMVRSGADRAQIEGVFKLPGQARFIRKLLLQEELQGDEPDRLVIAREVRATGRSISRVNGRIVPLTLLRQITTGLVDVHGQSEHLSLMRVREHLDLLDRYAGLEDERERMGDRARELDSVRSELKRLRQSERELARKTDLLSYQIGEIQAAALQPGERQELQEERNRLSNAEQLAMLVAEAYGYLDGENGEMMGIRDLLGNVERVLSGLARIDGSQVLLRKLAEEISYQVEDLVDRLRDYREQIEHNPRRLAKIEDRLEVYRSLMRKYGDSVEDVLAFEKRARDELEEITHSEERIGELSEIENRLLHEIGELGAELSKKRSAAAAEMSAAIERELGELQMAGSRFSVELEQLPDPNGVFMPGSSERVAFDSTGLDKAEFLISPNPGEPLKPMIKIASGGETSRLMLAIKTVLSRADETATLIFDEIDQGIGGRVGYIVGQKLWGLASGRERQVICITHLPQLAGFGHIHYRVEKQIADGRTTTRVMNLESQDLRVQELAEMLGGDSPATRSSAFEILKQIENYTQSR